MDYAPLNDVGLGVFGEPVVIKRVGKPDTHTTGVYSARHHASATELAPANFIATLTVQQSDVGEIEEGDVVHVRGRDHSVYEPRVKGNGMLKLALVKADFAIPVVAFQTREKIDDGAGNEVSGDFETVFSIAARYKRLTGSEAVLAARVEGLQPTVIRVPATEQTRQVTNAWRAVDERTGEEFDIIAVVETVDQEWIEITATSGRPA